MGVAAGADANTICWTPAAEVTNEKPVVTTEPLTLTIGAVDTTREVGWRRDIVVKNRGPYFLSESSLTAWRARVSRRCRGQTTGETTERLQQPVIGINRRPRS